jgi:uncharacterized protein YxjI
MTDASPPIPTLIDDAFMRDKFLIRQKVLTIGEKYDVRDEQNRQVLFVERPAHLLGNVLAMIVGVVIIIGGLIGVAVLLTTFDKNGVNRNVSAVLGLLTGVGSFVLGLIIIVRLAPKRHITIYADESKQLPLLRALQDQKFVLFSATYTIIDNGGNVLATLSKNYIWDIFRKRWEGRTPDGKLFLVAMEDSIVLSILRRMFGPLFGLLRTNFVLLHANEQTEYGVFNRKFTLFDRYVLDLTADRDRELDRRVAVALGVLLDTGERR